MIVRALSDHGVPAAEAFLVGDRDSDMEAARRASVRGYRFAGGDLDDFVAEVLATEARRLNSEEASG